MNQQLKDAIFQVITVYLKLLEYLDDFRKRFFGPLMPFTKPMVFLKVFICLLGLYMGKLFYDLYDHNILSTDDWVIVQTDLAGSPIACYYVENATLNTEGSALSWRDEFGSKHHVSSPYRAIEVENQNWDAAFMEAGLTSQACAALKVRVLGAPPGVATPPTPPKVLGREYRNIY